MSERGIDIALACAERGWRVFPVSIVYKSGGRTEKHPLVRWTEEASADPDGVRALWSAHPGAKCGVVTGRGSGLYVVDVDSPGAVDEQLGPSHLNRLGSGWLVQTNRPGGVHYYFAPPGDGRDVPNSQDGGLDVRGDGGMVVCWRAPDEDMQLNPLPATLAEWARGWTFSGAPAGETTRIPETIVWPGGNSDAWVVSMAGTMCRRGFREEAALAALLSENEHGRFDPPCDEEWLATKVRGVYERYYRGDSVQSGVLAALQKRRDRLAVQ